MPTHKTPDRSSSFLVKISSSPVSNKQAYVHRDYIHISNYYFIQSQLNMQGNK